MIPGPQPGDGPTGAARVTVNGIITWTRIVGVLIARLVTTRLLLEAMGIEGYGAYFAAVSVALLIGFLTAAMQSTSLRAIALETGGEAAQSRLFNALLGLHLLVALAILGIGASLGLWFVNAALSIPAEVSDAAAFAFLCILVATTFGAVLAPYEAFLQSRERFAVFAVLDLLGAWLMVPVSYWLTTLQTGRIETFALISAGAAMATALAGVAVALRDYPATRPRPRLLFDASVLRRHGAIFSWTLVGSLSAVARTQGLTIIVNVIGGPVASAAFAVGNQIAAAVGQFATSIRTVLAPRIYGREAQGDRDRMLGLAFTACKISTLVALALAVPLIVEMPAVLRLWLGQADTTILFVAIVLLINQVIDQTSAGTGIAHMATGRIARYQLVAGGVSLVMLPVAYWTGATTGDFRDALVVAVAFTALVAVVRVRLFDVHVGGATRRWLRETWAPVLAALLPPLAVALAIEASLPASVGRLVLVTGASGVVLLLSAYLLGLTSDEKTQVRAMFRRTPGTK
ncbi:MAG: hypothetical protein EP307_04225 [Rhodobacteraceae bacterium]|nr:MAG: hypothetical protein EP307_04225 [Paracoccaceae bacterium]